jgi:hypothetical protein
LNWSKILPLLSGESIDKYATRRLGVEVWESKGSAATNKAIPTAETKCRRVFIRKTCSGGVAAG